MVISLLSKALAKKVCQSRATCVFGVIRVSLFCISSEVLWVVLLLWIICVISVL